MNSGISKHPALLWLRTPQAILLVAIIAILALRLATLGTLAVTDNTEARHAEIGWQMYRSGDWVTPRFYMRGRLEPFWGKPPLSFWMTAMSYKTFGVSEWATRLPNWLLGCVLVLMTVLFGRKLWGLQVGLLAGLILASSGLFFVLSGTCVLDMALSTTLSMAMMAFALFVVDQDKRTGWGRIFFFSLGLGCLAKGPVAVVLAGLALAGWLTMRRQWSLARRLPWISGSAIAAAVAAPWYVLAERANPGFLDYFLVNEHILRYLRHDYGDRYGGGHTQPYGASWVMLAIAFLPWTPLLLRYGIESWRDRRRVASTPSGMWLAYAIVWGLTPALFFTLCRQILVTYMLPGFAGLALATAVVFVRWQQSSQPVVLLMSLRWSTLCFAILLVVGFICELISVSSSWTIVGSLVVVCLFCAVAWQGHKRGDAMILASATGLALPLFIAMVVSSGRKLINDTYSAKTIVERLSGLPQANVRPVILPMGDEYSANFYVEACHAGQIERHEERGPACVLQSVRQSPQNIFVFKRKHWQALDREVRSGLLPIAQTRYWIACGTKKSSPPAPSLTFLQEEQRGDEITSLPPRP